MKTTDLPFNIEIAKVDKDRLRALKPVTTTDMMGGSGQVMGKEDSANNLLKWQGEESMSSRFHSEGLFSTSIFGSVGDPTRDKKFSFISIKTTVLHPIIYNTLLKLNRIYGGILAGTTYAVWNSELSDFEVSNEVDGETGYSFFIKHWENIVFKTTKSPLRTEKIKLINKYKHVALTSNILVLPAGLRDIRVGVGNRLEFDEINDIYRKIIGVSNGIKTSGENTESSVLDYSRYQITLAFNSLYKYIESMLKGKRGFIQSKWAKRRLFNGTRNVISAMRTSRADLDDIHAFRALDTIFGLFQALRGFLPHSLYGLRTVLLDKVMGIDTNDNTAFLVDPTTLKRVKVELNPLTKDQWSTLDGLEKVINSWEQKENRHRVITIEDYYLALIYRGPDNTFKVFQDISELPKDKDRKHVYPITLSEFLYYSTYMQFKDKKVIPSRYPIGGIDSVYPSNLFIKSTIKDSVLTPLDDDWSPMGSEYIAPSFPSRDGPFLESMNVSNLRLAGLGGDFDGDLCSGNGIYSTEGIKEIEATLASKAAYVNASNKLRASVNTDVLSLVIKNMTK